MQQTSVPPMNFEQAIALMDRQFAMRDEEFAKQEALRKAEMQKRDEELRMQMEKRDEDLRIQMQKRDEEMQKRDEEFAKQEALRKAEMEKRDEEFRIQMQKRDDEMKKRDEEYKKLSRRFGDLGNRLGEIIEYMVTPQLKEKFDKYGFYFRNASTKVEVNNEKRESVTEIDVVLYDGDKIMAVEVKTKPTTDNIDRHVLRMQQIIQYPNTTTQGKKVYGAIAAAIIENKVLEAAFNAGFYVISQTNDMIEVIPPPDDFVAKF